MARIRSFDAPHKGLRNILSKFSLLASQTDYSNIEDIALLKRLGNEMFLLLKDHVHTENEYTLIPLEARCHGAAAHDIHDHELLELQQDKLERMMQALDGTQNEEEGHRFYLEFTSYHSRYLQHIYEEETVTERLLQENFSDEELMAHRASIMKRLELPVLFLWLKYVIPAQPRMQRLAMLSAFKANAPKDAFAALLLVIEPEMNPLDYSILRQQLQ